MKRDVEIRSLYDSLYLTRSKTLRSKELINDKIKNVPGHILISIWKSEKDMELKKQLEILIARKLNSYGKLLEYNDAPDIYLEYLEKVTSMDAIIELMDSPNEKIKDIASIKYKEFFDRYLDESDKCEIIEFERSI